LQENGYISNCHFPVTRGSSFQQQQHAIEDALEEIAAADADFARQLEEAYNRTENDQFTGLIVKNLENIQGDERDIIIMRVCYGFDVPRRMLMNFGPVNKRGGEKRLNVLFSRARMHTAVTASIRFEHITNEYNEGASYLRPAILKSLGWKVLTVYAKDWLHQPQKVMEQIFKARNRVVNHRSAGYSWVRLSC